MGTPFLSEIRIFTFSFAPRGWAFCNGQLLPINQNAALFDLVGTNYGGNGSTTFGLPNLQSRVPTHMGNGFTLGQASGETSHTLAFSELPAHTHTMQASNAAGTQAGPSGGALALPAVQMGNIYGPASSPSLMAPQSITQTGGSQPHDNMQPYLVLNFCIALQGIFPSQN